MPPNYEALRATPPARLAPNQRRWVWAVAGALVISGVGVGAWAAAGGGSPTGKCVTVVVASSTGGIYAQHCGADARKWCATEATAPNGAIALKGRAACRREGFLPH
jgi:hypothetical protein